MTANSLHVAEAAEIIQRYDNFLIVTHENPDGDALGSVFALLRMLHDCGKTAEALIPEPLPEKYLDFASCDYRSEISIGDLHTYNCCIMVDIPKPARAALGYNVRFEDIPLPVLNIDHHPDNSYYAKWNVVQPAAAAAAEILFTIFQEMKHCKINPATASLLMLGIVMDTGGFRFDNTSATVLRRAADLLELKADYHHIIRSMFFSNPLTQQEFEAELILHHLKYECDGRFAWFFIPPELVEKYQVDMRNTEGLIEALRAIRGTDIVAIMQPRDNGFKISLRSKDARYSVGGIARKLNGGGHELAAGGLIKAACRENAEKILIAHVERVLNEIQS
jgi:phosphoesterase RecJ-like protein